MFLNKYGIPVRPNRHPSIFVHPTKGGDQSIIRVLDGKLVSLTQGVPTMRIEWIPIVMPDFVLGISTT